MELQDVRETYANWARVYDATHTGLPYRREARLALDLQPGERVLDLACGTGLNFAHLRQLVRSEGHITGVDLSPDMLAIANRRIARYGWANVETREADAAQLPFPADSFDKAICTFAMNIIPDYTQAIEEVVRVVVPGGRFAILDGKLDDGTLHGSPGPVARAVQGMHMCGMDITHRTLDELRRVFASVEVREHWRGFVYIAVATKGE